MITVVDYKIGNLGSVLNMFKKINVPAQVSNDPQVILNSDGLLFPGIGRFDYAMSALKESGLVPVLEDFVFEKKKPLLGICVGFQMMAEHSEEGDCEGLSWFKARVNKFRFLENSSLRIPHMGWNTVQLEPTVQNHPLMKFDETETRFYFAHSYYVSSSFSQQLLGKTEYGVLFDSALADKNLFGVQFHPEKSHRFGMRLFQNFGNIVRNHFIQQAELT
jgi:glutamine amidotransferase